MKYFRICLSLFLLVQGCVMMAVAQTDRATITGTVTDTSQAALPNAQVTVTNTDTRAVFTSVSNSNGV